MKKILTTVALILAATLTQAHGSNLQGDRIAGERLVAIAELTRIADSLDAAVDVKDWGLARSFFADEVVVYFSMAGGKPARIRADDLIAAWSKNLTAEKTSFHLRTNHRVTFDGADAATMLSHGYAWNRMERGALEENGGNPLWEVWGIYEYRYKRTDAGWKIHHFSFQATAERGNEFVRNTPGS